MFDFHLHSKVSFDSQEEPEKIVKMAEDKGLKEICFTDHHDHNFYKDEKHDVFTLENYSEAYDHLKSNKVLIRRGVEYGLTVWNKPHLKEFLTKRDFDFVIGSVHYADGYDPYYEAFWGENEPYKGFEKYLLCTLDCVKEHEDFDVLGHLNYVCKSEFNPLHKSFEYSDFSDITDEIMKILVSKGKGMEINTSGVDRNCGFLPSKEYFKRFKELGGEIVTVGSDAHTFDRVGQYTFEATEMLSEIFGYVCTFENRKPIFHKVKR